MTLFWNDAAARRKALIWGMLGLALVMLLLWPHAAWASDTTGGLPYESYLTKVRQSMTGTVGYTFALVGIVVAGGVLIFGGDLNGFVRTLLLIVLAASRLVGPTSFLSSTPGGGGVIPAPLRPRWQAKGEGRSTWLCDQCLFAALASATICFWVGTASWSCSRA